MIFVIMANGRMVSEMRLIDADALYEAMQDAEELARRRVLDTESTLPYPNNLNPAYTRYLAQMDERTKAKEMVADAPTVDAVKVVRCKDCKYAEVADPEDSQDGYTCQFHRGSIWFSDSYCSWAER